MTNVTITQINNTAYGDMAQIEVSSMPETEGNTLITEVNVELLVRAYGQAVRERMTYQLTATLVGPDAEV